jgi:hypothetical protein
MRHLTSDELLDVIEQVPAADRQRQHIESCEQCRAEAAELSAVLSATRRMEIPEPSPLFWDQFSRRIHEAITREPRRISKSTRWLRWPVLVPLSGLALLMLALAAAVASRNPASVERRAGIVDYTAAAGVEPSATLEMTWALVADLVGPIDLETAHEAGIAIPPGAADEVAQDLSTDEREELVRLLRQELGRPGG